MFQFIFRISRYNAMKKQKYQQTNNSPQDMENNNDMEKLKAQKRKTLQAIVRANLQKYPSFNLKPNQGRSQVFRKSKQILLYMLHLMLIQVEVNLIRWRLFEKHFISLSILGCFIGDLVLQEQNQLMWSEKLIGS